MAVKTGYQSALENFRVSDASVLVAHMFKKSVLSVAELIGSAQHGHTAPVPQEHSYIVQLRLRECIGCDYYIDGRRVADMDHAAGVIQLHDLRSNPTVDARDPFHIMHIHLPMTALATSVESFTHMPAANIELASPSSFRDPVILSLFHSLRPSIAQPEEANSLYIEHIAYALCVHLASRYGGMQTFSRMPRGGLAPWQARRVREMLDTNMDTEVTLARMAAECGLSVRHFSRVFNQTFGMPPHRYQVQRRVEMACRLLLEPRLSLSEVAIRCGFATQSHLSRLFLAIVGTSPGEWRRQHGGPAELHRERSDG